MDLPIWHELGIEDGIHGYLIKNIDEFDVSKLYNKIHKFVYEPPKSNWEKYLAKGKGLYMEKSKLKVKVQCIRPYRDLKLNKKISSDDEPYEVSLERAEYLRDVLGTVIIL
jgi:hypothetical protein